MGVDTVGKGTLLGLGALRGAQSALRTEVVDVPALGGQVMLRELSGAQRTQLIEQIVDLHGMLGATADTVSGADLRRAFEASAEVVRMTWIDGDGNPVIQSADDFDLLLRQPYEVVLEMAGAALRLSGLTPDAKAQAKKNSTPKKKTASGTH